jgi:DNA polymerase
MPRKSEMRKSIIAPEGHVIVVADSSQIELRLNAWLSGEEWILEEQRKPKGDVYRKAAAAQFGIPPEEVTPDQRQFGKVITLGAGYSMSADKFRSYCGSGPIGLSPILLTEEEAQTAITNYRKTNPNIVRNWKNGDQLIKAMHSGVEMQFKCLRTAKEAILLPNGLALFYPNLKCAESATGGNSWSFGYDHKTYTYGAKIIENIVQALARIVITDQLLAMEAEGLVSVGSTHDEILVVCKEEIAEETFNKMIKIMSIPPKWCSDLPLAAEGGWAKNYSK